MRTTFGNHPFCLTPLAGCLATALALASGAADAVGHVPRAPYAPAQLDRVRTGDPPQRPDPTDLALHWQPAPHALPEIPANSIVVHNCNDSGNGSLRDALTHANNGDTIDLTQLSCSTITLTTGSILFTQTTITLQGPGAK